MDEYIKRQDALEKIEHDEYYRSNEVKDIIRDVPAEDVDPVVRGHWEGGYVRTDDGGFAYITPWCTNCGRRHDGKPKYCENCGAKMDGGIGNDKP